MFENLIADKSRILFSVVLTKYNKKAWDNLNTPNF